MGEPEGRITVNVSAHVYGKVAVRVEPKDDGSTYINLHGASGMFPDVDLYLNDREQLHDMAQAMAIADMAMDEN